MEKQQNATKTRKTVDWGERVEKGGGRGAAKKKLLKKARQQVIVPRALQQIHNINMKYTHDT